LARLSWKDEDGQRHYHDGKVADEFALNKTTAREFLKKRMKEQRNRKLVVGSCAEDLTYADLRALLIADYEIQSYKSLLTAKDHKTRYLPSLKHLDNFFGAKDGRPAKTNGRIRSIGSGQIRSQERLGGLHYRYDGAA
jgi:hypothetical protein